MKQKINSIVVLAFLFNIPFLIIAQPNEKTKLYVTTRIKDYAPKAKSRISKSDIGKVKIIYHHEIDPENSGQVDYKLLKEAMNIKIPDSLEAGYCVLDWEGPQFEYLKFGPVNPDSMQVIVKKFREMLAFAKKQRPSAKWGIYDMPVTTYWVNQDTTWEKRSALLEPLLKECSMLNPSLYDYFQTGSYDWMDDEAYYKITTKRSLELGLKYDIPVVPFIWHRYHDATEKVGLLCISPKEFSNQIKLINNTKVNGKGIDGLIWWNEDQYYFGVKDPRVMAEAKGRSKDKYLDDIALKSLDIILKALN